MQGRVCAFDIHIHIGGGWMKGEMKDRRKRSQAVREGGGGGEEEFRSASGHVHSRKRREAVKHPQRQAADPVAVQ